ncbi:Rne/Rng family ribonuclease [Aurantiacibacter poecillastricola]|uniref:Rne/Rng family ribonuclease n=1 Tax=Aurantiacibacter poecillastricola TaxID=3064385 RepID=UPI00273DCFD5|nr:Rne/Rng family ribonuclease [Aurantiacibacter sp. 219JJ12-13]MDP5262146.1 Rne/Rng family ribonuclease [Aurantiacibacter sp. 219JJ12-13]
MATRMLIDARHPEETRVAVLKGNRIEEFDFESAEHKQIKGNIYLAKVTRVEPSLQAAFVDFGGNRHGFLAFSEIHPDYYQIPAADREALLAEEQAAAEEEAKLRAEEDEDDGAPMDDADDGDDDEEGGLEEIDTSEKDDVSTIEDGHVENGEDENSDDASSDDDQNGDDEDEDGNNRGQRRGRGRGKPRGRQGRQGGGSRAKEIDEARAKRQALRRRYKIQDVIQRRQVLLVQVAKEERGNKGAALTTYLSLAGRYCVLMPNSSHGGGISRKISSGSDRKRLKNIVGELRLPKSMGLIVRTAGLSRTKPEIKRDFDYLARLWDEIRERTMNSSAPSMIHSDSDLIKRAIRDIYNREIEEVIVEGEAGYKAAKSFMKLLMPSHARRVKSYNDPVPLFQRYGAEDQLSAMYDPMVQLKSGGYLIINPTEALVSIDINSGRSTKEHGIEQTALHTNLEAAKEIARQLRLRDMAGLVVIDFIDMERTGNVRKVERCMKDALKNDRARIQVGRISGFGLMEMSRQRLRTGVLEATTCECPHCDGTGLVRTASSAGLSALRLIEDEAAKGKGTTITLHASTEAAVYLLNAKRADLAEIEQRYGVTVEVKPEGEDEGAKMRVGSSGPKPAQAPSFEPIIDDDDDDYDDSSDAEGDADDENEGDDESVDGDRGNRGRKRRRRRRGGRGRNNNEGNNESRQQDDSSDDDADEDEDDNGTSSDDSDQDGENKPRRRRGRRGGRGRGRKRQDGDSQSDEKASDDGEQQSEPETAETAEVAQTAAEPAAEEVKPKRRTRRKKAEDDAEGEVAKVETSDTDASTTEAEEKPKPKRTRRKKVTEGEAESAEATSGEEAEEKPKPKRTRRKKVADAEADGASAEEKTAAKAKDSDGGDNPVISEVLTGNETPLASEGEAQADDAGAGDPDETADGSDDGSPRRGWWQRTFGN